MTVDVKDPQGSGIWAEAPATHSHHQGLDPAWSSRKGHPAPTVRSVVLTISPEQVVYQRRWATETYLDWDKGEDDQAEFDYGRRGAFM